MIRTLTYRCFRICSSHRLLQSSLDECHKTVTPEVLLIYNMNDVLQWQQNKPLTLTITVPKKKIFLVLP